MKNEIESQLAQLQEQVTALENANRKLSDQDISTLCEFDFNACLEKFKAVRKDMLKSKMQACEAAEGLMATYQAYVENLQGIFAEKQQAVEMGGDALSSQQDDAVQRSDQVKFLLRWLKIITENIYKGEISWATDAQERLESLDEGRTIMLGSGGTSSAAAEPEEAVLMPLQAQELLPGSRSAPNGSSASSRLQTPDKESTSCGVAVFNAHSEDVPVFIQAQGSHPAPSSTLKCCTIANSTLILISWGPTLMFASGLIKTTPWQDISSLSQVSLNQWELFVVALLSLILSVTVTTSLTRGQVIAKKR